MSDIYVQTDQDLPAIEALMADAFGPQRHERSVWALRPGPPVASLCLVIREGAATVGSLRFWEVMLGSQIILLLGPLAVRPGVRGRGFGRALISEALDRATGGDWPLVLVSGEVDYYPRFGFVPAAPYGIDWPGFIEPERLQFYELQTGALAALPPGPLAVRSLPG
ncbi:MAG: N-acetyltransferase [SAR116 cluster bacterium]|nr:MAG: N-acetyltransferase [SAR116 cluster bacterium]|tara:strand:+ start:12625 stop:13122 length:498 start_codon:yes stop_codon:yes gene_type:complete